MSGINDITITGKLTSGLTQQKHTGEIFTIDNKAYGGSILSKTYDVTGVLKQITMDPLGNLYGINNLNSLSMTAGNLTVVGETMLSNNLTMYSTSPPQRQMTASYYNFSSSSLSAPTYTGRIYASGGINDGNI
jgi:hypothetical protein